MLCSYGEAAPSVSHGLSSLKKRQIEAQAPSAEDRLPAIESPHKSPKRADSSAPLEPVVVVPTPPSQPNLSKREQMKRDMNSSTTSRKARPTRPSLSQQLANIGQQAGNITAEIKKKAGISDSAADTAVYSCPARSFSVGNLQARVCTSLVYFYADHAQYVFHHPYQTSTEITMRMYYRDMQTHRLGGNKFAFHVAANLHQCFTASDYNPSNPSHMIVIEFASSLSMAEVKKRVLPLLRR